MRIYRVKAIDKKGEIKILTLNGENKHSIKRILIERGFTPLSIKFSKENFKLSYGFKKIKDTELINFYSELYSLLKAGLPLLKSLSLIRTTTKNPFLSNMLSEIIVELEEGKSFSEALENYTEVFGNLFPQIVKSGEESGSLAFVIKDYNDFFKRMVSLKKKIYSSMIYPSAIFIFSTIVLLFIVNYVIPRFGGLYREFGAELPFFSKMIIAFGNFLSKKIAYFIVFIIVLFWGLKRLIKTNKKAKFYYHKLLVKAPLGDVLKNFQITNFLKSFSMLLQGGIVILKAFEFSSKTITNLYLYSLISPIHEKLYSGESLSSSLEETKIFHPNIIELIKVGETSGSLSSMLKESSEYLDEAIMLKVNSLVSFIEPAIILIMGIIIGVLLLAVYLPLFTVVQVIK